MQLLSLLMLVTHSKPGSILLDSQERGGWVLRIAVPLVTQLFLPQDLSPHNVSSLSGSIGLSAQPAAVAGFGQGSGFEPLGVAVGLGADETALEIAVDHPGGLGLARLTLRRVSQA